VLDSPPPWNSRCPWVGPAAGPGESIHFTSAGPHSSSLPVGRGAGWGASPRTNRRVFFERSLPGPPELLDLGGVGHRSPSSAIPRRSLSLFPDQRRPSRRVASQMAAEAGVASSDPPDVTCEARSRTASFFFLFFSFRQRSRAADHAGCPPQSGILGENQMKEEQANAGGMVFGGNAVGAPRPSRSTTDDEEIDRRNSAMSPLPKDPLRLKTRKNRNPESDRLVRSSSSVLRNSLPPSLNLFPRTLPPLAAAIRYSPCLLEMAARFLEALS